MKSYSSPSGWNSNSGPHRERQRWRRRPRGRRCRWYRCGRVLQGSPPPAKKDSMYGKDRARIHSDFRKIHAMSGHFVFFLGRLRQENAGKIQIFKFKYLLLLPFCVSNYYFVLQAKAGVGFLSLNGCTACNKRLLMTPSASKG